MVSPGCISLSVFALLVPPDAIIMRRSTQDIIQSVSIQVHDIHLRTFLSQICGMKYPVCFFWMLCRSFFGTFPPTVFHQNIFAAISIYVTISEAMCIHMG